MSRILLTIIFISLYKLGISQIPCSNAFELDRKKITWDTIQPTKRIYLYGGAAIATSNNTSSTFSGVQRFAAKYVFRPISELDSNKTVLGFDAFISMNLINITPNAISQDSLNFLSMMFPETGNTGFILGPQITWGHGGQNGVSHLFKSELSFSLRQNKISMNVDENDTSSIQTTKTCDFTVLNYNVVPIKYIFEYEPEEKFKAWLSISPYVNILNIPNEDVENFNLLFSEPIFKTGRKNSKIPSAGVKFTGGINGLEFYIDLRNNFNLGLVPDNNPFKGFVFTGGFTTNIQILAK